MQWLLLGAGALLLLTWLLLTLWFRQQAAHKSPSDAALRYVRLRAPRKAGRLLCRLLRETPHIEHTRSIRRSSQLLLDHLRRHIRRLRQVPPLPAALDGEPRLMELARDIADLEVWNVDRLIVSLTNAPLGFSPTSTELAALPSLIAQAQTHRLQLLLEAMHTDARHCRAGQHFARKLSHSRHPQMLLARRHLYTMELNALLQTLHAQRRSNLASLVEQWLSRQNIQPDELAASCTQRQEHLTKELHRVLAGFEALTHLEWAKFCSQADDLHALLLQDPEGIYPKMTASSQMNLRLQIDKTARFTRKGPLELARHALLLCQDSDIHSSAHYIGNWFETPQGLSTLCHACSLRKGRWRLALHTHHTVLRYSALWAYSVFTGFWFLQSRQPVFMLPFFAVTSGSILRHLWTTAPSAPPMLANLALDEHSRTLVVLHAHLADAPTVIQAFQQLEKLHSTFPQVHVDFLLLGDFSPSITAVSGTDYAILQAANSALAEASFPVMYIQRGRAWSDREHRYVDPGGHLGAIDDICRLSARGEGAGPLAYSSVEGAWLERRHAYILFLTEGCQPARDALTRMLQTIAHPSCRNSALLLPEEFASFDGIGLIRPDEYLERTEGLLAPEDDALPLAGELAAQRTIPGAHIQPASTQASQWDAAYVRSRRAWSHIFWQLSWVQTPSGLISNPLGYFPRFRLREELRHTMIPLAQMILLLWAVLIQSTGLLFVALLPALIRQRPSRATRWQHTLSQLSLLPMHAAVCIAPLFRRLQRKSTPPDWVPLEVWAQSLTAVVMASLGFVLQDFSLPCFALCILFACFPLAHRVL